MLLRVLSELACSGVLLYVGVVLYVVIQVVADCTAVTGGLTSAPRAASTLCTHLQA